MKKAIKAKTFYSVLVSFIGNDAPVEMWFYTKKEADEVSRNNAADLPIRHTFRNAESIEMIENIIAMQYANF